MQRWNVKNKSDASNKSKTNHLKIVEKIYEKHTWKPRHRETEKQNQLYFAPKHMLREAVT